jgi:nucleotide-binding universal stress UspA family protein
MSGVVCAIRGGPRSQLTINQAIRLSKDAELPLYFLYVVNLDFLSFTESSRTRLISKEMHEMGEFILVAAQTKAQSEGVEAEGVVRHGEVTMEIIGLAKELSADYIVLGQPEGVDEKDVFTMERLKQFSERLSEESGAQVIIAEGGEV